MDFIEVATSMRLTTIPAHVDRFGLMRTLCQVCFAAVLAIVLVSFDIKAATSATSGAVEQPPAKTQASPSDTVTVEAYGDRADLERRVDTFVSSIVIHNHDESLLRWSKPLCPLVAGLLRDQSEFLLARVSTIAREAKVPLAPEKCTVNFFVVVTHEPDALLTKWRHRDPRLFDTEHGLGKVNAFLNTPRPIRAWYNAEFTAPDGKPFYLDVPPGGGMDFVPINTHPRNSRMSYDFVRGISTAIVIVDANRITGLKVGQLSDYIALLGLAEIDLDEIPADAPTILHLFGAGGDETPGLTRWDKAFIKSLYKTSQASSMQVAVIEDSVMRELAESH